MLAFPVPGASAQAPVAIDLTLDHMVQLMLDGSYQIRYLDLNVVQRTHQLRAENARLRSRVALNLILPAFREQTEFEYDSNEGRSVPVRQSSGRWEGELSISQPVIIPWLGYPTNGYLSLRNRMYRNTQTNEEGERFTTHYNRYFVEYTQPLFQPNELKNDLEEARLNFEAEEINYGENMLELVDQAHQQYFQLFENAYRQGIDTEYVSYLEEAASMAETLASTNPGRTIELDQIRVQLANGREELERGRSQFRLSTANLRTSLNVPATTEFTLTPAIEIVPIQVDAERALAYARDLSPEFRDLEIDRRRDELRFEDTLGQGGFQVELEMSYGREKRHEYLEHIWSDPSNTYTVDVSATIPIWDWGQRDARIAAAQIDIERRDLEFEETEREMLSDVQNEIRNIQERQDRALTMRGNLDLARRTAQETLARYRAGSAGTVDLLQSLDRFRDTANNYMQAYRGWRNAIQELQEITYYDFEREVPIKERWGIDSSLFQ